jgi:hypothetical protein
VKVGVKGSIPFLSRVVRNPTGKEPYMLHPYKKYYNKRPNGKQWPDDIINLHHLKSSSVRKKGDVAVDLLCHDIRVVHLECLNRQSNATVGLSSMVWRDDR